MAHISSRYSLQSTGPSLTVRDARRYTGILSNLQGECGVRFLIALILMVPGASVLAHDSELGYCERNAAEAVIAQDPELFLNDDGYLQGRVDLRRSECKENRLVDENLPARGYTCKIYIVDRTGTVEANEVSLDEDCVFNLNGIKPIIEND